ncbi:MAG: peptidase S8 [Acidimicrobiaceae bacterium]|nr:peptidase S8 [Acidimicrobiaceae bacterium]
MADPSDSLNRPLLAFDPPVVGPIPSDPDRSNQFPPQPRRPSLDRQGRRLSPQFETLQTALRAPTTRLSDGTASPDPEFVVVFEVAGTIARFFRAAEAIDGLDFITDFVGDGFEPDDEFWMVDDSGERTDEPVTQALYLVMANARAIDELVRLFDLYRRDPSITFDTGLAPLKQLFAELHTVRRWGPHDRIAETGLLDEWRESIDAIGRLGTARVEIELVWRSTSEARQASQREVEGLLDTAAVRSAVTIPEINYHAVLADIRADVVEGVIQNGPSSVDLFLADDVLFVAPAIPMTLATPDGHEDDSVVPAAELPQGQPKVALLDGLPLANHDLLAKRLRIDDPEDFSPRYSAADCRHGTAMASLIIHGDLSEPGGPIGTPLHCHPVMVPHDFFTDREEVPRDRLFVDLIHTAFRRMFAGEEPSAPSARIVNISLGDPARPFVRRLSPLARLLDYLAFEFNVLIVVSAGNHDRITPTVPVDALDDPARLDASVRRSLHEHARLRRLLSPAESINALTVGALHEDASDTGALPDTVVDGLAPGSIAAYSPSGAGFRRAPKPEIHAPGGRSVFVRPVEVDGDVVLQPAPTQATGPGVLAAAALPSGATGGVLYSSGTSNAAALVTRSAHEVLSTLESLEAGVDEPKFPDPQYHPVLVKALLVHAASWPENARDWAEQLDVPPQLRRPALTQMLGYGRLDPARLAIAAPERVTLVGAGSFGANKKRQTFEFPLPPDLSSPVGWRRLTVTLAWFSPTVSTTQQYRVAALSFGSPRDDLRVRPTEAAHFMDGKGTVQHEVLEGRSAAGYTSDATLAINVDCRVQVGRLWPHSPVRFGLAVSLEVGPDIHVDVFEQTRQRLRERTRARVRA